MFLIDFNKVFENLPDEPEEKNPPLLKAILSFALARAENVREVVKVWDWAMTASKVGVLKLDATDKKTLRDVVNDSKVLMVGAKAQLLNLIDSAQEAQ